jgi:hypothetical protein
MNDPHILGTERIGKLLVQYSIPAIIGMTITSLYNIIDSIFIGHGVGAMGIAGLAITLPLSFPIKVDSLRQSLSSEDLLTRIERMKTAGIPKKRVHIF